MAVKPILGHFPQGEKDERERERFCDRNSNKLSPDLILFNDKNRLFCNNNNNNIIKLLQEKEMTTVGLARFTLTTKNFLVVNNLALCTVPRVNEFDNQTCRSNDLVSLWELGHEKPRPVNNPFYQRLIVQCLASFIKMSLF